MLSEEEYQRDYPYMKRYAEMSRVPPNRGFFQAPLYQGGVGMLDHAGSVAVNSQFYVFMANNYNAPTPYLSGLNQFAAEVTPKLHEEVRQCTLRTRDPVGCNIAGVDKAFRQMGGR